MEVPNHNAGLQRIINAARQDERIVGVAVGGSYGANAMDIYSDLDVVIIGATDVQAELFHDRFAFAESVGSLLSAFTGEHVGEPRLLICLYGPPLLHVDLKYVSLDEFRVRVEDPVVVWERDGKVSEVMAATETHFPELDLQWIEDRIWTWFHYGATKLGRGELFEFIDMSTHLRSVVFGPMIRLRNGTLPRGVRRIETEPDSYLEELVSTVAVHSPESCAKSLSSCIHLYGTLRSHFLQTIQVNHAVESAVIKYCQEVIRSVLGEW